MNFEGVSGVVWARERRGGRVRFSREDEVRVGQYLCWVCRVVCGCGCERWELQVEVGAGKGEYVMLGRRGRGVGNEWFSRRSARRASDLCRSREPSGLRREERFKDAKFQLEGEGLGF